MKDGALQTCLVASSPLNQHTTRLSGAKLCLVHRARSEQKGLMLPCGPTPRRIGYSRNWNDIEPLNQA